MTRPRARRPILPAALLLAAPAPLAVASPPDDARVKARVEALLVPATTGTVRA